MFEKPFRLHFSSIIEDFFKGFWVIIVILITNVFQNINQLELEQIALNDVFFSVSILLIVIAIIFLIMFLRWRRTYLTLTSETLVIEKLLINKKIITIGLKNISNVDFEQNIFEKIIGTAKLKLDTNSLSTANQNDVKIILKLDKIKELKKQILLRIDNLVKDNNINEGDIDKNSIKSEEIEECTFDEENKLRIKYNFERVIYHTLLSVPIFSILLIIGFFIFFVITIQNPELSQSFFQNMFGSIIAIAIIVVPIIYSSIRNVFRLYDFKAQRIRDKIHISYGLFTTRKFTIPVDKINAVIIKQSTLSRIFKKYTVEIVNVGMVEENNETPVLLLMCDKKELEDNLHLLLPELTINVEEEMQPKEALVPIFIKMSITSLVFIIPTLIFSSFLNIYTTFIIIVIILFAILSGILMYKTHRLALYENSIYITKGIFMKKTVVIKIPKIQLLVLKNSVLTKKLKIQKIKVQILAAAINLEHQSGYFKNDITQKILEKYK